MHKDFFNGLKQYALMALGVLIMTLGIYFFKIPNGFATGGISGLAIIIGHVQPLLTPGQLIPLFNILLLIIGFLFLGKENGIKTVFCCLLFSALSWLFEQVIPLDAPLTDQPLMELICGVILVGIGSAVLFDCGASSGGTDITALILKKYTSLDVGKALLLCDLIVAFTSFFVYDLRTGLFSLLGLFANAFLIDGVIEAINECKSFTIVTQKPEAVTNYILYQMRHSATCMDARGAFSGQNKTVILTLCRRSEAMKLKRKLKELDPSAFVIVTTTSEIIGRGFREI